MVYDVRQRTDNELYEKNELTNAINRVIEDMNHEFLASVLTRTFKSSDLGIVSRQLMTDRDAEALAVRVARNVESYLKALSKPR